MREHAQHIPLLDILKGVAISGIIFANIFVLGGYRHISLKLQQQFSSGFGEQWLLFGHEVFLRNKFYTLFAFLFGLSFSVLLNRARAKENQHFVRAYIIRMAILFALGWLHALFFFPTEILRIYAIAGLFMLLFKDLSNKNLLIAALFTLFIPVIIAVFQMLKYYINPEVFFPYSLSKTLSAFQHGPWTDFILANYDRSLNYLANNLTAKRFFKILGLFLLGFYVGRKQMFYHLDAYIPKIKRMLPLAWVVSLTTTIIYVTFLKEMNPVMRELVYILSVYPLTFTYVITVIYFCHNTQERKITQWLAEVGRMSLTNYLAQSVLAGIFMLWFGFGLATRLQVSEYYLVALIILVLIFIMSHYWMKYFRYGPVESLMRVIK